MNHVVSLGQREGDGLWSWTELALNPSSVTSRQDVLIESVVEFQVPQGGGHHKTLHCRGD